MPPDNTDNGLFVVSEDELAEAKILVVDDEDLITSTLSNFLFVELEIDAITFNKPKEAAAYLAENDIDLVISDFPHAGDGRHRPPHRSPSQAPPRPPRPPHRLCRQGKRHQGHQPGTALPVRGEALGQRPAQEHHQERPRAEVPSSPTSPTTSTSSPPPSRTFRSSGRAWSAPSPNAQKSPTEGGSRSVRRARHHRETLRQAFGVVGRGDSGVEAADCVLDALAVEVGGGAGGAFA